MRHRHISCILTLALLGSFLMPSNQRATAQTAPAPAKETTLPITGLKGRVLVRRDERGIPHIEAASEDDLYFAQGYVTAQDRLWQMDLLRRTARGELSELFGQLTLEDDKRRRTYGFTRVAEASLATVSQPARAALEAYARGVNAYIASLDGSGEGQKLPVEFALLQYQPRPWTPLDSLVLGKNFAEVLSTTWPVDLMRAMLADLPVEKRQLLLPSASPLDVIVVGSARAARKKAARFTPALPASEAARSALWRELAAVTESINRTRELFGHAAPGLDASNNWVVSG
ncbi:MAG: penicillin acylase family protein, partial [Pyrinomonadaceae bacterium]|nr:penicillin acylase family protein [Pyrinomonadaceae bacterium]